MKLKPILAATLTALTFMAGYAHAEEAAKEDPLPNWKEENLTGDWSGLRTSLWKKGIEVEIGHKSDILSSVKGGVNNGTAWLGHTNVAVTFDLEKSLGWNGTTAYFDFESDLGSKFNKNYVGSTGVDNAEVGYNTAQFFEAWIEKNFMGDMFSLKGGLYAVDSEFYVTDTSGLFLQPPFGMSNEVAQTDTPAIFPVGAIGVRAKVKLNDFYGQVALMDGVAADPTHHYGTHIRLGHGEGTMTIAEFGYQPDAPEAKEGQEQPEFFNKFAVGVWQYSRKFDDLTALDASGNPERRHSRGYYFLGERTLFVEPGHPSQGLSAFARFGTANDDIHDLDYTMTAGLNYHGLIDGRDDDLAGVAISYNHAGDKAQRVNGYENAETAIEVTYKAQLKPWLSVQPDVQYIMNPGMDKTLENVWVVGFRTEVEF